MSSCCTSLLKDRIEGSLEEQNSSDWYLYRIDDNKYYTTSALLNFDPIDLKQSLICPIYQDSRVIFSWDEWDMYHYTVP